MGASKDIILSRHIQLENSSGECSRLYAFLDDSLEQLPVSKEFRHDIKLVSEELFANIINHAYDSDTSDTSDTSNIVEITLVVDARSVHIKFIDSAPAFNPLKRSSPDLLNDLSEGGMGILLVKSLSDEQHYKREDDHNVFTVTKHYNN